MTDVLSAYSSSRMSFGFGLQITLYSKRTSDPLCHMSTELKGLTKGWSNAWSHLGQEEKKVEHVLTSSVFCSPDEMEVERGKPRGIREPPSFSYQTRILFTLGSVYLPNFHLSPDFLFTAFILCYFVMWIWLPYSVIAKYFCNKHVYLRSASPVKYYRKVLVDDNNLCEEFWQKACIFSQTPDFSNQFSFSSV